MKYAMTAPNMIPFLVVGVFFLALLVFLFSAAFYRREAGPDSMRIRSLVYNTELEYDRIRLDELRVLNLKEDPVSFNVRTNGIGLPGLWIGWFRGGGGRYKLYLTDRTSVLRIPTTDGYEILFSTGQGERIIQEIREKARAAR